jgi:hypothetical protein
VSAADARTLARVSRAERRYDERLSLPWYWWPAAVAVVGMLALQLGWTVALVDPWLPAAILLPVTVAALWWSGRLRVAVTGHELHVDDARLPLAVVADAIPLDAAGRRELLGPAADPRAFVVQRPWVPGAVQVLLDDPADPTPYWLVSSRDPDRLAGLLTGAGPPAPAGPASGSHAG